MPIRVATSRFKLISLLTAIILFALLPLIVKSPYYIDLLIMMLVRAVLAASFILTLRSGMINLSIGAFWGIGAYASTILVLKFGLSFWPSIPVSAVITGIVAVVFGYFLIGTGKTGFSFVLLSAILGMLFSVVVGNISYLGKYTGIDQIPRPDPIHLPFLPPIEFGIVDKVPFFYLAFFLFLLIVLILKALYRSRIGTAWKAISLSPRLAESLGINVFRYKMIAFVVGSIIVGFIGSFFAHYQGYIVPDTFNMWININLQVYAILGGIGYAILGPLIGSTVMTFLPELVRTALLVSQIITGILLILLIKFLPGGLLGLLDSREKTGKVLARIARNIRGTGSSLWRTR